MRQMRIGVLGTGDVGKVLGSGLVALGHDVEMGSRDAVRG
jgi:predicted dinucleotide-binding enzyme